MPHTKKFKELLAGTKEYYTGRKVPREYQGRYGKVYSAEEAESIAYAIARKKKWRI